MLFSASLLYIYDDGVVGCATKGLYNIVICESNKIEEASYSVITNLFL